MSETDPAPMMRAAVQGTTSLLTSALAESIREPGRACPLKSVVFMSTISAVFSPTKPAGHVFTEADWNDVAEQEVRRLGRNSPGYVIYQASKTAAERAFWRFGRETGAGFGMTALCPAYVTPFFVIPSTRRLKTYPAQSLARPSTSPSPSRA